MKNIASIFTYKQATIAATYKSDAMLLPICQTSTSFNSFEEFLNSLVDKGNALKITRIQMKLKVSFESDVTSGGHDAPIVKPVLVFNRTAPSGTNPSTSHYHVENYGWDAIQEFPDLDCVASTSYYNGTLVRNHNVQETVFNYTVPKFVTQKGSVFRSDEDQDEPEHRTYLMLLFNRPFYANLTYVGIMGSGKLDYITEDNSSKLGSLL